MYLKEPHNMLISGVTNCGKTHFVLDLLENEYRDHFENIVLFCPTYIFNKTYNREYINKMIDKKRFIVVDPETVKKNLDVCIQIMIDIYKGTNSLFVIDDCANLHDSKKKESEICQLAFSGRHYKITTWIINQKYNSIVKDFRENIRFLVLFFNKDEKAMKQALEENNVIPKEERKDYIQKLKDNHSAKLLLRLEFPFEYEILL